MLLNVRKTFPFPRWNSVDQYEAVYMDMQFGADHSQDLVDVAEMHLHSNCILQGTALNVVLIPMADRAADRTRPRPASVASQPALG
jgi:hypothetical protein